MFVSLTAVGAASSFRYLFIDLSCWLLGECTVEGATYSLELDMAQTKFCPSCGLTVGEQIGGKLALGATGALVGSKVDPLLDL
jgi:hypothetical protein